MHDLLVVDDARFILECFRYLFPGSDVKLHTATTGEDALRCFQKVKPDVALLDVQLPDLSVLDLFRRLRELEARTPVIFMTGQGTSETAIEAMRLGAYDYVVKPFDPDKMAEL